MATIQWQRRRLRCLPGETVLGRLQREGIPIPYNCRSGTCWLCMLRARNGRPPARAQESLRPAQRATGLFLSCQCVPEEDLVLESPHDLRRLTAVVRRIVRPAPGIARLQLDCAEPFDYRAGQFVQLDRGDGRWRAYSLASVPAEDDTLELHVEHVPGGLGAHLCEAAREGDALALRGPFGECFYIEGRPEQPLILAGTGVGLAPLIGIARDALGRGHTGPVRLVHGAPTRAELYAHQELLALAARHAAFYYQPRALDPQGDPAVAAGRIEPVFVETARLLRDARVFLCGAPAMVDRLRQEALLAGIRPEEILTDPFLPGS